MAPARLESIEIRDYRNLEHVELELPSAGLVLIGDNGQGKTNFLEAVYYFQLLRSARGARDVDAVRFGADAFSLAATLGESRSTRMAIGFEKTSRRKRVRVDGVIVPRLSDALGLLPAVMLSPADTALAGGEPSARRRYLDVLLALTSRKYLAALQAYRAALLNRNAAIRDLARGRGNEEGVAAWEPALATHGGTLVEERREWIETVRSRYRELCSAIGERAAATLEYHGGAADAVDPVETLCSLLAARRTSDIRRGGTHTGPHRDAVVLSLGGHELRTVGSAGQQRTAAVSLRLLEAETYERRNGVAPIFLMDDPFAELDVKRGEAIVSVLRDAAVGQIFLAVPRISDIPDGFARLPRATVESGVVNRGA
jgi:DNA replication and repair protein RecF